MYPVEARFVYRNHMATADVTADRCLSRGVTPT